ncbi:MAG: riboflavin kinase, partial [Brevinema sp.]
IGADYLIIANFESIKHLSEKKFIETLLTKSNHITLYSGDDFRFGTKDGESYIGSQISYVKESELEIENHPCRSTKIRHLLLKGDIDLANKLLGYEYKIYSINKHGDKLGRQIGFPTINIAINNQIVPQNGVYFTNITVAKNTYPAMTYIGRRPTIDGMELRIESHIIDDDFDLDLELGIPIELAFINKISEEKRFKSLEELTEMLYNYKEISLGLATKRYQ